MDVTDSQPGIKVQRKGRTKMLLLITMLALALGGGGFHLAYTGRLAGLLQTLTHAGSSSGPGESHPETAFVPLDTIMMSLSADAAHRQLRLTAQLEVPADKVAEVTRLVPRIRDVANTYLHAVDPADFDEPIALIRLRDHLLYRCRLVVGEDNARDLLITEFLLN